MNKITIIGRVVKDAELRSTPDGTNVCSFTVAVDKKYKKKNEKENNTDYFKVTAWRKLADICGSYVKKGNKIAVVGSVSVSTYTTQDGQTRASLDVTADDVEFLSSKSENGSPKEDYSQAPEVPQQTSGYTDVTNSLDTDDLPF